MNKNLMPTHEDGILQKRKGTRRQTQTAGASFLSQQGDVLPQIEAAQDSAVSGRIDTMNIIYELEREKHILYNAFIRFALEDSNDITIAHVIDSLELETDVESRVKLVEMFLADDSLNEAEETLESIKLYNEELRQYQKITKLYLGLRNDDKDWLDADSEVIEKLWDIVETRTKASVKAQNILSVLVDTTFSELIEEIEEGSPKRNINENDEWTVHPETTKDWIKIYPNPASNELTVELTIENSSGYVVRISNLLGGQVLNELLEKNNQKKTFDIRALKSGVYIVEAMESSGNKATRKVIVLK